MSKNIVAILLLLPGAFNGLMAQKTNGPFTINGKIKGQEEGFIYLNYAGADGKTVKDSSAIKNGSFEFKGQLQGPVMANMNGKVQSRSVGDPNFTNFFLEPSAITIEVEEKNFKSGKPALEKQIQLTLN